MIKCFALNRDFHFSFVSMTRNELWFHGIFYIFLCNSTDEMSFIIFFLSSLFLCIQCDTTEFYNHSNNFLYARIVETMYDKYLG